METGNKDGGFEKAVRSFTEELLWKDPDKVFSMIEDSGSDLNDVLNNLKKLRIGRLLATERYPDLGAVEVEQAVDFVFWLSYWMEREIRDDIFVIETALGKPAQETEKLIDEMNFGSKIKFLEDNYIDKGKKDEYIETLRTIKNLRNSLSHGDLNELVYGGYHLSDPRGQIKLTVQIRNSARRISN